MKKALILIFVVFSSSFYFSNIHLSFNETPLQEVLQKLEEVSGSIILTKANISEKITKEINTLDLESALDIVLHSTDYEYKKVGHNLYLVGDFDLIIQGSVQNATEIDFKILEITKISNILKLLNQRVRRVPNSNSIILFGKDELSFEILNLFNFLEDNAGENKEITYSSSHKISKNVYDYLLGLEKNQKSSPIENQDAIGFLESNFSLLTDLEKVEFYESFDVNETGVNFKDNINNYYLVEKDREYIVLVTSTFNLENLTVEEKTNIFSQLKTSFGVSYQFDSNEIMSSISWQFNKSYFDISFDFNNNFKFGYKTALKDRVRIGAVLKNEEDQINISFLLDDYEDFNNFGLYGILQINSQIENLRSILVDLNQLTYDLVAAKTYTFGDKQTIELSLYPGIGLSISKKDQANIYFNFGVQYAFPFQKSAILLSYLYHQYSHTINLSIEF
ncbi:MULTISPECIES: hypothetical protein [Petrotoga]|uniref:Secretin/TonB short N-terminal domain-containing protein n=2 Tax=Petrotoga sibirica TaxID=156202 RepID=A0A4R8EUH6_9BACT|nr:MULTISPECIES: hypothetical protein [Petrotoga]POZ89444.1 hypothetical protein AA80_00390 [Petrotoga sibirica DSM 13575]POZ91886.1 hypothetical protein AD60_00390 [Petrotoga sp. SL27]TDX16250.1 hypothetical protein C8D74_10469 [Petrotoga sibirica]